MRTPGTAIKGMADNGLLLRSRRGQRRRALVADASLPLARRSVLWRA